MLANGHAYHDPKLGSKNTNFALLVSHTFSEPFNEPNEFAHEISRLANKLSMVQLLFKDMEISNVEEEQHIRD